MQALLEDFTPSGSGLRWRAHQDYYREEGLDVFFRQEVPYNITSNPCYAEQVAKLCIAQHAHKPAVPSELHILELGGGNGIFAYNFLTAFASLNPTLFKSLRYVLSDFSEPMLEALGSHAAFSQWLASGQLSFQVIDARGSTAHTTHWDSIIANYLFSTFATEIICKPGEQWCIEKTRLSLPVTKAWMTFIARYLRTRDLSAPLAKDHPHKQRFASLFKAQQRVADKLSSDAESPEHTQTDLWAWLEKNLFHHWISASDPSVFIQKNDRALLTPLLIAPLQEALSPHLWQAILATENEGTAHTGIARRFFPLTITDFPPEHQQMLKKNASFYPMAYAPEVLNALSVWKSRLKPEGVLLVSDKASISTSKNTQSNNSVSIARHGGTLSHALNWPLCLAMLPGALHTQRGHHAIQTLCYSPQPTPALISLFQEDWVEHPRHLLSHALLEGGQALLQSDRVEAAYRSLKEALDYRPHDGTLQYFCALCCMHQGDYITALEILRHPHDDIFALFNRDILMAEAYQCTGQYAKALPAYQQSMVYGENALTYYQMALCQQALKADNDARKSIEKAYQLHPEDEDIQSLREALVSSEK